MQVIDKTEEILYISFNQEQDCFVCGTNLGFKVYNAYPYKEILVRDMGGGIGIVEMLYKTNMLALVGGGSTPKFPPHKVILWDDYQGKIIGEMTFKSDIRAVKMRQNKIAVVIDNKCYIQNLQDLTLIHSIETCFNPKGLFGFSLNESIVCCPDKQVGYIHIRNLGIETQQSKPPAKAHSTPLSFLEINQSGTLIATASEKGTLIRLFSTASGELVQELRRGTEYHVILSISFHLDGQWLACTSDSGTVHIFSLSPDTNQDKEKSERKNNKSKISFLKVFHSYFDSEWSYAHIKLNEKRANVVFAPEGQTVIVATFDGNYYVAGFDGKDNKNGSIQDKRTFFTPLSNN